MLNIRKANQRGHSVYDWLDSRHSFSFADYYDPEQMGFRSLRVINQDRVAPGQGFPLHPHRDMEILSFVLEGALRHKDNLGNEDVINSGEVQRMTAGTGIMHSEYNASESEEVHFLQIWIEPRATELSPGYEICRFDTLNGNRLQLLASPDGRNMSATIQQEVLLYSGRLETGQQLECPIAEGRHAWLQLLDGKLTVNGQSLLQADGLAISSVAQLTLEAFDNSRFLLFDLG